MKKRNRMVEINVIMVESFNETDQKSLKKGFNEGKATMKEE